MITHIDYDERAWNHAFHSWDGMFGQDLRRRSRWLEHRARTTAGYLTGALRRSIGTFFTFHGDDLEARVGANPAGATVGYALYHHEGTRPHIIKPKNAKALRFKIGRRTIYAAIVHHPGTRPNPYLTQFLREAVS